MTSSHVMVHGDAKHVAQLEKALREFQMSHMERGSEIKRLRGLLRDVLNTGLRPFDESLLIQVEKAADMQEEEAA